MSPTSTEIEKTELLGRTVPPTSDAAIPEVRKVKELLSGTVPPKSTVTLTATRSQKLFGRIVPPTSTATRRERKQEELLPGTVPPSSTATQTGKKKIGLLWGTVPPTVSTATQKTEARKSKIGCLTAQTSQIWNQESEVAKVKLRGKANSKEVLFLHSEVSQARGGLHKSSKKIQLPTKVSEMRKIWEKTNVPKFDNGPEISETATIFAKPMGGQDMPTVL